MTNIKVKIVGCGDAFGTGGLHSTCFYLESNNSKYLIDIGAGSVPNLKALDVDLKGIDTIIISHFHGDHFGGLPNFLLDAIYVQGRTKKLTIIGPKDLEKKVWNLQEAMYEGTSSMDFGFPIDFIEYGNSEAINLNHNWIIEAIPVIHSEPSNPYAIRLTNDDKSIVYTGDTEWTDNLLPLTQNCDLLISECFGWEAPTKYHLNYQEIITNIDRIGAKRIFLTHLGPIAFARQAEMQLSVLKPGMEIEI